jgi:DNA polymerase I-like protein with 3'-5' exonuclease and polymerase domains
VSALSRGQLAYAAADAVLTRRVWEKTSRELKAKGRDRAYRLQRDCLPAAAAMELRGVALDLDAHAALCDRWGIDLAEARNRKVPPLRRPDLRPQNLASAASHPARLVPRRPQKRQSHQ